MPLLCANILLNLENTTKIHFPLQPYPFIDIVIKY